MKRALAKSLVAGWVLACAPSPLRAQTPTFAANAIEATPGHVRISLHTLKKSRLSPKRRAALVTRWKKACQRLAESLLVRGGAWEHGIFKDYGCYDRNNVVAGKPVQSFNGWMIDLHEGRGSSELKLRYFGGDRSSRTYATVKLLSLESTFKALQDPQGAALLALRLLAEAPMSKVVTLPLEDTQFRAQAGNGLDTLMAPASGYRIFTLVHDKQSDKWRADPVGTATLGLPSEPPPPPPAKPKVKGELDDDVDVWSDVHGALDEDAPGRAGKKKKWQPSHMRPTQKAGVQDWAVRLKSAVEIDARTTYWAQVTDPAAVKRGADDALVRVFQRLGLGMETVGTSWDRVPSGYLGARYGHPMTKGDDVIAHTPIVGVLAEVRDGALEGLRWAWDFAPETKVVVKGRETSLVWSRPTLGWSFGLDFDNPFLRRVDVVPKLGVLDLDAKLPVTTPDPNTVLVLDFRTRNAANLGLEVGAESAMNWFLVRLWAATDVAGLGDTKNASVSFLRGGVDGYWDVTQLNHDYDLSALVFAVAEKVRLTRRLQRDIEDTTLEARSVSYLQIFVGAGLTVGW